MKLSITEITRKTKDLSEAIIRGETITLTRHGEDFAVVTPYSTKSTSKSVQKRHATLSKSKSLLYEP